MWVRRGSKVKCAEALSAKLSKWEPCRVAETGPSDPFHLDFTVTYHSSAMTHSVWKGDELETHMFRGQITLFKNIPAGNQLQTPTGVSMFPQPRGLCSQQNKPAGGLGMCIWFYLWLHLEWGLPWVLQGWTTSIYTTVQRKISEDGWWTHSFTPPQWRDRIYFSWMPAYSLFYRQVCALVERTVYLIWKKNAWFWILSPPWHLISLRK